MSVDEKLAEVSKKSNDLIRTHFQLEEKALDILDNIKNIRGFNTRSAALNNLIIRNGSIPYEHGLRKLKNQLKDSIRTIEEI
jgi:hypothetical protein